MTCSVVFLVSRLNGWPARTHEQIDACSREINADSKNNEDAQRIEDFLSEQIDDDLAQLTESSNAVIKLVRAGQLDEAELAANELLVRFPEVHDGYARLGMVGEARGLISVTDFVFVDHAPELRSPPPPRAPRATRSLILSSSTQW